MKTLAFLGDSLKCIREFPEEIKQEAGYQLWKVQRGEQPDDFRPMPSIGAGVEELRLWSPKGMYRVIYIAKVWNKVYVIHAFQKKTPKTSKRDMAIARQRYADLRSESDER